MMRSAGDILTRAGYSNWLSIIGGFRGPREAWFQGTLKKYLYKCHVLYGQFVTYLSVLSFILTFIWIPDVGLSTVFFLGIPLSTCLFSVFNLYYMEFGRSWFIRILKLNEEASEDRYYQKELDAEIKKWSRRAFNLQHLIYFVVCAPIVPWGMVPIINEMLGSPWGSRRVSFITWFPYDYQQNPYWIITIIWHTSAGIYGTLINVMFNAVFICITFRQIALLVHLKKTFPNIFQVLHVKSNGQLLCTNYEAQDEERRTIDPEMTERLKYWIKHHQQVLSLVKEVQSTYSFPLLIYLCYTGTVLATGSAAILMGDLAPLELYVIGAFLLGSTFTLFVICRVGDFIKVETYDVVDGLYGQNYYLLSKKQHSLLKTLLIVQRKPIEIRIFDTFPLTAGTFKSVIGTTYSFFAMFTQMQKES